MSKLEFSYFERTDTVGWRGTPRTGRLGSTHGLNSESSNNVCP